MPIDRIDGADADIWWGKLDTYSPLALDLEPDRAYTSAEQYGEWFFYLTLGYTSKSGTDRIIEFAELLEDGAAGIAPFDVEYADERHRPIRFSISPERARLIAGTLRDFVRLHGWRPFRPTVRPPKRGLVQRGEAHEVSTE